MRQTVLNTLAVALSFFLLLEIASRVAFSYTPTVRYLLGFDSSSYRLFWKRLHSLQADWTGPVAVYHPIRGWALKPNVKQMALPDGTVLSTNSRGIRGVREYPYERVPGMRRILLLGDSFTFGLEVADDDTFGRYLETHFPNTEVINLGVQGYGNDQMLLYLNEEGVKYHPDIIIVGFVYIDIYRNIEHFYSFAKPEFRLVNGRLRLTHAPVPSPDRVAAEEPYRLKSLDFGVILWHNLLRLGKWEENDARERTVAILHEILKSIRAIRPPPVFVYLPVDDEIVPGVQVRYSRWIKRQEEVAFHSGCYKPSYKQREEYLRGICKEQGVACLFLGPRFREEAANGTDFRVGSHWNPKAHSVAGAEIQQFLLQRRQID